MDNRREELEAQIEKFRKLLDESIERNDDYGDIYKISVKLDSLVEEYITAGY